MFTHEWNEQAVADRNQQNLKGAADGATLDVQAAGRFIVIGDGHDAGHTELFLTASTRQPSDEPVGYGSGMRPPDLTEEYGGGSLTAGTVTIKKGGVIGNGSLTFKGIHSGQDAITSHIAGFSKKKVVFE